MTTTAAEIREALCHHWPADQYLTVEEAPEDAARMGRKIDLLVVSYWASRGHSIDAVEIKVSMTDWKRELTNAAKADFWWQHSDRFWVAVPREMASKVHDQLPESWGLLSVDDKVKVHVQAPKHDRQPLPWKTTIGVIRASAKAGLNVLARAEAKGEKAGYERAHRELERASGHEALEQLREQVRAAEEATGIPIARWSAADREAFGWISRDEVHAALSELLRDRQAAAQARSELQRVEERLFVAHDRVAKVIAGDWGAIP